MHTHDAVNPYSGGPLASDTDRLRYAAYSEGMRAMRDKVAVDLTYVAEGAPTKEAADYIWKYIMALKGQIIT